ncbi:cytochrome P450 [Xylaria sp. FL1042]|nr:cytochrome P450 [Xylaria sp. FL1042]
MSETTTFALAIIALAITIFFIRSRRDSRHQAVSLPRIRKRSLLFRRAQEKRDFASNGRMIINEGYQKYKESMFVVQTTDMERLILSPKYAPELRMVPESTLSTRQAMCERHLGRYTGIDIVLTSTLQSDVCRTHLTQNLRSLIPVMREESVHWLTQTISKAQFGIHRPALEAMLQVTAGVSSRILVGLPTSRNAEWLETCIGYTLDVFHVSTALRPYPDFIRPFIAPWLQCTKRLNRRLRTANKYIIPIVLDRLENESLSNRHCDLIQWMLEISHRQDRNPEILTKKIMFLTLAAIHTSTMSITHVLFDLCSMPHYIEDLRQEIIESTSAHGWTLSAMNELKLLDSFMKESQRINHPGLLSFNRKVLKPLQLSDGKTIPAGSFISMPTDSVAHDPSIYPNPQQFDGYRFYRKRQESPKHFHQHQFSSIGPDSLAFGYGKYACPGRFFASAQIKLVIATLLTTYDINFPDGQTERPLNSYLGESIGPNRTQVVVFTPRG